MSINYVLGTIVILSALAVFVYGLKCLLTLHKEWEKDSHEKKSK